MAWRLVAKVVGSLYVRKERRATSVRVALGEVMVIKRVGWRDEVTRKTSWRFASNISQKCDVRLRDWSPFEGIINADHAHI